MQKKVNLLSFDRISSEMEKYSLKQKGKDPLNDIPGISQENIDFFVQLIKADSTDDLDMDNFSLEDSLAFLNDSSQMILVLDRYINKKTILSDTKTLSQTMESNHLRRKRRIL